MAEGAPSQSGSWGRSHTSTQTPNSPAKNSIFVVKYIFPKYLPEFINNSLSSRSSECTAARFKYPASRPGGGGRYSLPLRAVSSTRHSPLHTAHRLRGGR